MTTYTRTLLRAALIALCCSSWLPQRGLAQESASLYSLPLSFENDSGQTVSFSSFRGKPLILTLAYTHCGTACPVTLSRLKILEGAINEAHSSAQIAIVSMDPARDTVEQLKSYRASKQLGERWHLLRAPDKDVRSLSVLVGVSYRKDEPQGEIMHSNKLLLLDADGRIVTAIDGLDSDLHPIIDRLAATR